jgi:malonate-semialdehyde dehydrogenase (acetylating)/methylmalonate-semialdehyde dehydrogenase
MNVCCADAGGAMSRPELIGHWIDGKREPGRADRMSDVFDPATGEVQARVALASTDEVDAAVSSAARAFESWRASSLAARTKILFAYRELLERHKDDVVRVITSEHGKVLADALGEFSRGLEVVEFACGIPHLLKGDFSENVSRGIDAYSIHQPLGVVAGITPFNFPAMVPMWMFPVAIACGNAFVLKPSERDPSASLILAELFHEAGLPEGVFNVVQGDKEAVTALLEHPDVAAVSSVGSTPVARYIYETAARHGKRVQALGGAKNHMVVLPDADVGFAADAAVSAGYGSTGQRCMAISAIVAVGDAADPLIEQIVERIGRVRIGPGTDDKAEMGPLVTPEARDRVVHYIEEGMREGAELVVDGRDVEVENGRGGFFVGPTLFDRVTTDMKIYQDEIFGPVLDVLRVPDLDGAIDIVNANPFGNGTAIFTANGAAARRFQHNIAVGMVGINVPIPTPMAFYSFGGWKQSLFGDAHVHGREGVHFYTRTKAVTSRWPESAISAVNLGFPSN